MNHKNSGLAYGTSGSPQLTFENGDAERLAQDIADNLAMESSDTYTYNHDEVIEAVNKNNIEFLRTKLTQTSPIEQYLIPLQLNQSIRKMDMTM